MREIMSVRLRRTHKLVRLVHHFTSRPETMCESCVTVRKHKTLCAQKLKCAEVGRSSCAREAEGHVQIYSNLPIKDS
jgi:hypothetical protein